MYGYSCCQHWRIQQSNSTHKSQAANQVGTQHCLKWSASGGCSPNRHWMHRPDRQGQLQEHCWHVTASGKTAQGSLVDTARHEAIVCGLAVTCQHSIVMFTRWCPWCHKLAFEKATGLMHPVQWLASHAASSSHLMSRPLQSSRVLPLLHSVVHAAPTASNGITGREVLQPERLCGSSHGAQTICNCGALRSFSRCWRSGLWMMRGWLV